MTTTRSATRWMAALAAVACLSVTACGTGSSSGDGTTGTTDTNASLRVGLSFPPSTVDPHRAVSSIAGFVYISPFYDRLTQMGPNLELRPMVATSWNVAPDGRETTFRLRQDVTFSDGARLDAAAVKASLERGLTVPGSTAAGALSVISGIDAVDPTTLRITTKRPAADLPYILAGLEGSIISPKALGNTDLDRAPVGSGPYTMDTLATGDSITMTRRAGYWDPAAQGSSTIRIVGMPNDSARLSALRSGQLDMIMTTPGQFDQVSKLGDDFAVHSYPPAATYAVWLDTKRPLIAQESVRQALNFAVDRDAISRTLFDGQCKPNGQPLGSAFPAGHLDSPPISYNHDPQRSRQLLAQAGLTGNVPLRLLVPAGLTLYEQLAAALQAQFNQAGFTVELVPQASPQLFQSWVANEYDGMVNTRQTGPTAAMSLQAAYLSPARYPGPVPPGFAEAVMRSFDPSAQADAAVAEASRSGTKSALDVFVCSVPAMWTATSHVKGADTMGWSYFSTHGDLRYVSLTR